MEAFINWNSQIPSPALDPKSRKINNWRNNPNMTARMIISVIPEGFKLAIRSWMAMRRGKHQANKSVKVFSKTLQEQGLPESVIKELTAEYRANADFLSIRGLSRFAYQAVRSRPRRK